VTLTPRRLCPGLKFGFGKAAGDGALRSARSVAGESFIRFWRRSGYCPPAMGETRGRSLVSAVIALWCIVVMAACGSASPPSPVALPTASGTGAQTPSAVPTPTPTSQRQQVEAAVRAYYAAVEHAVQTGDTRDLSSRSTTGCNCRALVARVVALFKRGSTRGASLHVDSVDVVSATPRLGDVSIVYRTSPYRVVARDGSETAVSGRSAHEVAALVAFGSGRWLVADVRDLNR